MHSPKQRPRAATGRAARCSVARPKFDSAASSNWHTSTAPHLVIVVGTVHATMALLLTALATSGLLVGSPALRRTPTINMGLHDLSAKGMDGTEVALKDLAGKKVLALNVASK